MDTDYEQMEMNPQLLQNRVKAVIKEIKLAIFQQDSNIEEIYQVICQKNKEMQLDQFVSFLKQIHSELSQYEMEITFKQFDKDASGTISKDEFFEVWGKGIQGNCREFMVYVLGFNRRTLWSVLG